MLLCCRGLSCSLPATSPPSSLLQHGVAGISYLQQVKRDVFDLAVSEFRAPRYAEPGVILGRKISTLYLHSEGLQRLELDLQESRQAIGL